MDIISYRGPGMAGGVSAALSQLWRNGHGDRLWLYLGAGSLLAMSDSASEPEKLATIPSAVIDGHYRFCNEFIWPVMHDMPERAVYRGEDRRMYRQFISDFARHTGTKLRGKQHWCFVQDYQLSLLPALFARHSSARCLVFWHVPWPRSVSQLHLPPLCEIARGLLAAEAIGFHTWEYAENFLSFVERYLPEVRVDRSHPPMAGKAQVVVAPLGVSLELWSHRAERNADLSNDARFAGLRDLPFVLSVDRVDYTKGVAERLKMIERFFEQAPEFVGKLRFVQVCGRTRAGLTQFDSYWHECRELAASVNARWAEGGWQPLVWIDSGATADQLALLYRRASVMLVNPLRDGLNLTAKEFAACRSDNDGALVLSRGAGVWWELGRYCLEADPRSPEQLSAAVLAALNMGATEKAVRMELMRERLRHNGLSEWLEKFDRIVRQADQALAAITRA